MKKALFILSFLSIIAFAEVRHEYLTPTLYHSLIKEHTPIIDIRTPEEWKETGIVKGSHPIMFFDEKGNYDLNAFIKQVNAIVRKGEPFALICHTGSRTGMVSDYLSKHYGYTIIDLKGGISYAKHDKVPLVPYQ